MRSYIQERMQRGKRHWQGRAEEQKADARLERGILLLFSMINAGRGGGIRTPDPLLPKQVRQFMETC